MKLPQLPQDKANHALYGVLVGVVATWVWPDPLTAVAAALLAGIAKEASDWAINRREPGAHDVEFADALATTLGGLAVSLGIWAAGL